MKKHNIFKRILALFLSLIVFTSLSIFSLAEAKETEAIEILSTVNAGGITIDDVSITGGKITVSGTFDGAVSETITYLVYDNNKNIIDIGETFSNSSNNFSIEFGLKEFYESVLVELKSASNTEKASVQFSVINAELELSVRIQEVESLISACENKGIKTDYEKVKLATAKKVLSQLATFVANGENESYSYNIQVAINLLGEAKESLEGYLDGKLTPKEVVRTATSTPEISGKGFISDTESGVKKPAFYVGYGHWDYSDLPIYKDLGVNLYQYEIGPSEVLHRAAPVTNWELSDYHSNLSNRLKYTVQYSTDGSGSVELNASGSGEVYISQIVDVKPNTTYTFGFSFKCNSASSIWIRANGASTVTKWVYDARNDSTILNWKINSANVTTGADQTKMTITIGSHNNMDALKYDNVFLKESGSSQNLLKNADFSSKSTSRFVVNESALDEIREVFKTAEDNDVSVVFLTAMHYFPTFVYDLDGTVVNGDESTFGDFMPYNPTHPLVLETLYAYLDAVIPVVTEYESLNSICVANEPYFYANVNSEYYLDDYRNMLKAKYGSISTLNTVYGTSYSDFKNINMPSDTTRNSQDRKKIAYFNDYVEFNQSIMTEYHKALYDKIKLLAPNVLVHTKAMEYIQTIGNSANLIQLGINMEELSEFFEINGCDAWSYYGAEKDTLIGKLMWYDYLTSVEDAPVFNTEDHILKDLTSITRSDEELKYNMADIWQGAIHGRGGSVLWLWDNTQRTGMGSGYYNANITRRADYMAEIGRVSLDLNRLSDEVTAIQNEEARVGILYSHSSLIQNPYALNASSFAYERALAHGEKVQFITENKPENLNSGKLELLIIPCSNYMKESTLKEIKTFIDNGGKVLFLNASGKSWLNEVGKAHDTALLQSVTSRSEEVSFSLGYDMYVYDTRRTVDNKLRAVLSELSHEVEVTSLNQKVEWMATEYDGKMVINLCNHSDEYTTVMLTANGNYDISNAVDLITGNVVGESFTLQENTPMLLQIESKNGFTFYDTQTGEETQKVTKALTVKVDAALNIKDTDAQLFAAVYKNERLLNVFSKEIIADENGNFAGELALTLGDDLSGISVKAFLVESVESLTPYIKAEEISY